MSDSAVATRYAEALYELAKAKGSEQKVLEDLVSVKKTLDSDPKAWGALMHPRLKVEEKEAALAPAIAGVDPLVSHTLSLIVRKRREAAFTDLFRMYLEVHEKREGILRVTVETATEVDAGTQESIEGRLAEETGRPVRAEFRTDKDLLGGMRFIIGSTVLDGSTKGRLERLKTRLMGASLS